MTGSLPAASWDSRGEFEIDPHWRVALNVNNVLRTVQTLTL
jgi:hypothetical protein